MLTSLFSLFSGLLTYFPSFEPFLYVMAALVLFAACALIRFLLLDWKDD